MLCQTCQRAFQGTFPREYTTHHSSIDQLETSAYQSCHICKILWNAISKRPPIRTQESWTTSLSQNVGHTKPISQYILLQSSLFRRDNPQNISELSFVLNKNGINSSGDVFLFGLQPLKCKSFSIQ